VLARTVGKTFGDFASVLDFGVGCGRVIRSIAQAYPNCTCTGTDVDVEAIKWLTNNYGQYGKFVILPHMPKSSLAGESADLIYAISVFTHLPENMQFAWLEELRRVAKPGAILLLTVHGENYLRMFPEEDQKKAEAAGGFLYNEKAELTSGLPEFYKNTYHTQGYVWREWGKYFQILDYCPLSLEGHQDIVVCKRE
jgi:ubiquinone/menaquinone biosynthesis C-methylase UbiE